MRQSFLFPDEPVRSVPTDLARSTVQALALNLRNPSLERADAIFQYLLEAQANLLILSELKAGRGADRIWSGLESVGFQVRRGHDPGDDYFCLIATKGFQIEPLPLEPFFLSHRVTSVSLASPFGHLDVIGIYGPSNNITLESDARRRTFQSECGEALIDVRRNRPGPLLLAGDLNVIEPGHKPPVPSFRDHDYEYYRAMARLDLVDAFRHWHPDSVEHSWADRLGYGQRLDHAFVSSELTAFLTTCSYDHQPRRTRLSDHSALSIALSAGLKDRSGAPPS